MRGGVRAQKSDNWILRFLAIYEQEKDGKRAPQTQNGPDLEYSTDYLR